MSRNFKTLEIGKYYVSPEETKTPVRIIMKIDSVPHDNSHIAFHGDNSVLYNEDGSVKSWPSCFDKVIYNLTTEVTVTITPVEPKKPRECWRIESNSITFGYYDNSDTARHNMASMSRANPYMSFEIIHMREVMEGDE